MAEKRMVINVSEAYHREFIAEQGRLQNEKKRKVNSTETLSALIEEVRELRELKKKLASE